MQNTTILKKNKNMVTRKIADETILLPIYRTSKEINCIYTLNKPASIVWDMIDGKTTVGEIKDKVLNNGFDLIKDKGLRIKDKVERGESRERERERDEKKRLKAEKEEVDSQLKVFFGELKEIKAVIALSPQPSAISRKEEKRAESRQQKAVSRKGRKMKFRPEITRVKLNPEQAVLSCVCSQTGMRGVSSGFTFSGAAVQYGTLCNNRAITHRWAQNLWVADEPDSVWSEAVWVGSGTQS